jgi:hypothetical protein
VKLSLVEDRMKWMDIGEKTLYQAGGIFFQDSWDIGCGRDCWIEH